MGQRKALTAGMHPPHSQALPVDSSQCQLREPWGLTPSPPLFPPCLLGIALLSALPWVQLLQLTELGVLYNPGIYSSRSTRRNPHQEEVNETHQALQDVQPVSAQNQLCTDRHPAALRSRL